MERMRLTFVVGTGRCGSTTLSAILREHPDILSMSEFFGTLRTAMSATSPAEKMSDATFPAGELDGRELWQLLARPFPMLDQMISSGLRVAEKGYPLGRGRFTLAAGVPLICHSVLPMLTPDPDPLYDTLAAQVSSWPRRPAAAQCEAFFGHLAGLLGGRPVVVERSAASLNLVGPLHEQFPAARFVHLYRDGPDCALSMSRHPVFRREILALAAAHEAGLPASIDALTPEILPGRFAGVIFPPYDAARLMSFPVPVAVFGRYQWSPMICAGVEALSQLPAGHWHPLRYEDLLADPVLTLTALCDFIGVDAPRHWLAAAARMVDPTRIGSAAHLPPAALASLRTACEPGTRALATLAPAAP